MASEKSGMWFLELILNILLLGGVAFVTFAARGEQERGLAVPLFAAVSPATTRPAVEAPQTPAPKVPAVDPNVLGQPESAAGAAAAKGTQAFLQAWGALQIWAAGLDGKITPDELKKIQDNLTQQGWSGSQSIRDYLKGINDRINAGQTDQVIHEALGTLAQQGNDVKVKVMGSVAGFMEANHVSLDQIQRTLGQWGSQVLHLNPADLLNSFKF